MSSSVALALLLLLLSVDVSPAWGWAPAANCDLGTGMPCVDDCMKRGHWRWTCDYACYYCTAGNGVDYMGGGEYMQISAISPDDNAKTMQNSLDRAAAPAFAPAFARKLRL